MHYSSHYSVLNRECLSFLLNEGGPSDIRYYADLTFGGGGHSLLLLQNENNRVIATDQDIEAYKNAEKMIIEKKLSNRLTIIHKNFSHFPEIISNNNLLSGRILCSILIFISFFNIVEKINVDSVIAFSEFFSNTSIFFS